MTGALQAVLWDMDGTLVDTEPYWIAAETELMDSFGLEWTEQDAESLVGNSMDHSVKVFQFRGVPLGRQEIIDYFMDVMVRRIRERVPYRPGARELLAELKARGIPCALVTMSHAPFAQAVVDSLPPGTFQVVVTGDQVTRGKPHPEPYLEAVRRLNAPASRQGTGREPILIDRCVALEDSLPGATSAFRAGAVTIAVPHMVEIPTGNAHHYWDSLEDVGVDDLTSALAGSPGPDA